MGYQNFIDKHLSNEENSNGPEQIIEYLGGGEVGGQNRDI